MNTHLVIGGVLLGLATGVAADTSKPTSKAPAPTVDDVKKLVETLNHKLFPSDSKAKPDLAGATALLGAPFHYDNLNFFDSKPCKAKYKASGTVKTETELAPFVACLAEEGTWSQAVDVGSEWKLANAKKLPKQLRVGGKRLAARNAFLVSSYITHAVDDDNWNLYRVAVTGAGHRLTGLAVSR